MKIELADQLPGALSSDPFVRNLTSVFDRVNESVLIHVDSLEWLAELALTPDAMAQWMTSWLAVDLDDSLSPERARILLRASGSSFAPRGTKKGVEGLLRGIADPDATVEDHGGVFGEDQATPNDKAATVTLSTAGGWSDRYLVALLDQEMPADVAYTLNVAGRPVVAARTERGQWSSNVDGDPGGER